MSLASIMSGNDNEPSLKYPPKATHDSRRSSVASAHHIPLNHEHALSPTPTPVQPHAVQAPSIHEHSAQNGVSDSNHIVLPAMAQGRFRPNESEVEAEYAKLEAMDISDPETPGFEEWQKEYKQRSQKRMHQVDLTEVAKRKVSSSLSVYCLPS
jgi:hypothetical protein